MSFVEVNLYLKPLLLKRLAEPGFSFFSFSERSHASLLDIIHTGLFSFFFSC
uniref:Uncharacterized protein n=1 Tax=Nelumbo nucifera TaxID=4432 RepID=A0A822ZGC5_NELNU|nr:TPA_asm: hypothetical protein HUJ06_002412 [Nelumbo nucifera]